MSDKKIVLPKDVADELEIAKECKDSFDVYIMRIINGHTIYENSHVFWSNSGDGVIKTLMDAWDNGYTVAKDKKYNLVLGTNGSNKYTCSTIVKETSFEGNIFLFINPVTIPNDLTVPQYQFTQSEIDKYNNDFWIKNIDLNDYKIEVTDDEQ